MLPVPLVNLINGGKHASNDLDFQEFIVIPVGADSILEALQISTEVNLALAEILLERYGKVALNTGDEGGFAPPISSPHEALGLLHEAVAARRPRRAASATASTAPRPTTTTPRRHLRDRRRDAATRDAMIELYQELIARVRHRHDRGPARRGGLRGLRRADRGRAASRSSATTCSSPTRRGSRAGIEVGAANSLLWKVNQIGTLSRGARRRRDGPPQPATRVVVSERSGETEDPIIADLAVALNAGQIKTGAPVRGERTAKYNRLIGIEEELGETGALPRRRLRRAGGRG